MSIAASIHEKLLFFNRFMTAPKQIGSVVPSSRFLCAKMIQSAPWHTIESVAELGPGTGVITEYIRKSKTDSTKVLLFEKEPLLRNQLAQRFPEFACYPDAGKLEEAVRSEGIDRLDCVLSGLPFFNFSPRVREELLHQIHLSLKPGGLFIAFQYSLQMRGLLSEHFELEALRFVPFNVPPAFVYVCRKQ
ncbi:phospholipid methyltransferase [Paenibacillus filicis]|uniref:Phospholipid methyltransferase n=1 Tax=Paenibacillus gyeongsangnamensis TaxID=3388067 RepID=A0ABT4Q5X7_9BACL|nr:phospholipid methyltransferase [Paenibacillus filicis]MCZ8512267.1 phospholipid methyltransferase [Paenibacillus filicis]